MSFRYKQTMGAQEVIPDRMQPVFPLKKMGVFGGSFDPIHQGHLNIAQDAYEEFGLDAVCFIPAGHSPNKKEQFMTPAEIRAEMTALAIQDIPHFFLSDIEIQSRNTSYTYLTLTKLKELYPDTELYFIMGADSLDYFERWCHPEIICQKAVILAAVRDDMDISAVQAKIKRLQRLFPAEIYPLHGRKTEVSSSELRKEISESGSYSNMIPKQTAVYIRNHGLYRKRSQGMM